jgi:ABC-type multidrug transport system permease subunit
MNEKLNNLVKFWIVIGILIGIIFGVTLGVFGATLSYFNIYDIHIGASNSIAIANTYIVFISIIFILFTIAVTIGGYVFSKIFTIEKQREIHQNIIIIGDQLKQNKATRKVFIDELLKDDIIIDTIRNKILETLEEENQEKNEFSNIKNKLEKVINKGQKDEK